jgi:anti-sigma factor RsiW
MVTAFVDHQLEPEMNAQAEAHLAACKSCQKAAAQERLLKRSVAQMPRPQVPAQLDLRIKEGLKKERLAKKAATPAPRTLKEE